MAAQTSSHVSRALTIHLLTEELHELLASPHARTHTTLVLLEEVPNTLPLDVEPAPDLFETRLARTCASTYEHVRAEEYQVTPEVLLGLSVSFVHVDGELPITAIINGVHRLMHSDDPDAVIHRPCGALMACSARPRISAASIALDRICRSLTDHGRKKLYADLDESIRRSPTVGRALYKTAIIADATHDPRFVRNAPTYSIPM